MTATSIDVIAAVLRKTNRMVVDDHRAHKTLLVDQLSKVDIIAQVGEQVVSLVDIKYHTIGYNALYIGDDGMVHISKDQVGAYYIEHNSSLEEAFAAHNVAPLTERKVTQITRL